MVNADVLCAMQRGHKVGAKAHNLCRMEKIRTADHQDQGELENMNYVHKNIGDRSKQRKARGTFRILKGLLKSKLNKIS